MTEVSTVGHWVSGQDEFSSVLFEVTPEPPRTQGFQAIMNTEMDLRKDF